MVKRNDGRTAVVFDSGIGGLNVLRACALHYPQLKYIYAADNYRVPYGNRSGEEVFALASAVLDGAMSYRPDAVVIACNTVTAECISELRRRYPIPVIGMQPAVKPAAKFGGKCLVLATAATANSLNFKNLLSKYYPEAKVFASQELADYIEKSVFSLPETLPKDLLPDGNFDAAVLGCTHYMFAAKQISRCYSCQIFDGAEGTAARLGEILGISDHQAIKSGKTDHAGALSVDISFYGGNVDKNSAIFKQIFV